MYTLSRRVAVYTGMYKEHTLMKSLGHRRERKEKETRAYPRVIGGKWKRTAVDYVRSTKSRLENKQRRLVANACLPFTTMSVHSHERYLSTTNCKYSPLRRTAVSIVEKHQVGLGRCSATDIVLNPCNVFGFVRGEDRVCRGQKRCGRLFPRGLSNLPVDVYVSPLSFRNGISRYATLERLHASMRVIYTQIYTIVVLCTYTIIIILTQLIIGNFRFPIFLTSLLVKGEMTLGHGWSISQ